MKVTELKKKLKELSKEELSKEIIDLFKKNEFVKDYYISKYGDSSLLIKQKTVISNEFFPKKGDGKGRLLIAKKAITEFKKITNSNSQIAELMVFYVEIGVLYTNSYGDIDEAFYFSMESMYEKAIQHIVKSKLGSEFQERCLAIVNDTEGIGWGFHDQLSFFYDESFNE